MNRTDTNPLRSLTRLLVGSTVMGIEALQRQLQVWEQTDNQQQQADVTLARDTVIAAPMPVSASAEPVALQVVIEERAESTTSTPAPGAGDELRYALIGLLFDTQARIQSGMDTLERVDQALGRLVAPVVESLQTSSNFAPARDRFADLARRGEAEVQRLVELGRAEELHSRQLVKTAARVSVDTSLHQVATNPEIREMVQQHSTSLANEMVEEVRERAVSADTLVERIARSLLGRTPREQLPDPPAAVRIRAEHMRSLKSES